MKLRHLVPIVVLLVGTGVAVWFSRPQRPPVASHVSPKKPAPDVNQPPEGKIEPRSVPELIETRKSLLRMDAQEARAWILRELDQGDDFQTQSDLTIGTDQNLATWPSYRVYLLDMLYLVDPRMAAEKSRELVEKSRSPDEWAVALRNVAKADTDGQATEWLQTKAGELLRNKEWRADPSAGYLNAFDVIVHTRHTALSPELLSLCDDRDQKAVRHAAFLTLDRLVQYSPDTVLPVLAQGAGGHRQSGLMLSNMMARADVRDAAQCRALEAYLLDGNRTGDELNGFASVFPNANFHVSHNLLTSNPVVDGAALADRDRASLERVASWLADPRFVRLRPMLQDTYGRLQQFVGQ